MISIQVVAIRCEVDLTLSSLGNSSEESSTGIYKLVDEVSVLDNNVLFTLKFKVAKLSQPVTALVKVAVCDPAAEKFKPFQVYGS